MFKARLQNTEFALARRQAYYQPPRILVEPIKIYQK